MESPEGEIRPQHRVRHITGIRIHQLTLPDALPLASKLLLDDILEPPDPVEGYSLGESSTSSKLSSSPEKNHISHRRFSSASTRPVVPQNSPFQENQSPLCPQPHAHPHPHPHPPRLRQRSSSSNLTVTAASHARRSGRSRAPTLAGEALEGKHHSPLAISERRLSIDEQNALVEVKERRLARSFVVMKIPETKSSVSQAKVESAEGKENGDWRRSQSAERTLLNGHSSKHGNGETRPPLLGRSSSQRSFQASKSAINSNFKPNRPNNDIKKTSTGSKPSPLPTPIEDNQSETPDPNIPFYISSIHRPSTNPRWIDLEISTDFAPWLSVSSAADYHLELEIWYEDHEKGWKQLDGVPKFIDLRDLKVVEKDSDLGDNVLEFTFSTEIGKVWYFSQSKGSRSVGHSVETVEKEDEKKAVGMRGRKRTSVRGIVERSMRETRMKKGVGVGGLHHLVNMQTVIADTQNSIAQIQATINSLLIADADARRLERDISERQERIKWIRERVAEVEHTTREVQATIILRRSSLEKRQVALSAAETHDELLRGTIVELDDEINNVIMDQQDILPKIHYYRSHHAQNLDSLFPITQISPSHLLYSILGVPLPIPIGPKDPAPPISLPPGIAAEVGGIKVDEKTTAAALGYVALVVQLLGNLGGPGSGLPYPVTFAGSRSLVKDVVSVMQGPRSFPLYTRGVEPYRYEYAVFLLNKDIESLMHEYSIRLIDIRHTLPNLKALLLTLSSPIPPTSQTTWSLPGLGSGASSTYLPSRNTSRNPSSNWRFSSNSTSARSGTGTGITTPVASPGENSPSAPTGSRKVSGISASGVHTPSPLQRQGQRRSMPGRNHISSPTVVSNRSLEPNDPSEVDSEDEKTET